MGGKWLNLWLASITALWLGLALVPRVSAGDPDKTVGPMDIDLFECMERQGDDGEKKDPWAVISIDKERNDIKKKSTGNVQDDINALEKACRRKGNDSFLRPIEKTKIEGFVYEFHPENPDDPAHSEWFAVPSQQVPVIAKGVGFEIFWVSEPNGYFYFYKTRFGKGPIILNLRLPEDAHAINPNIVIESTGFEETWTVFLGFYRGDVAPPRVDQLKTPDGNYLPFTDSRFSSYESIVGLDGESSLPGVGGELPQATSVAVIVLAAAVVLILVGVGVRTLRRPGRSPDTHL
ncbi:MAG: hypothetical protein FOGNACKC_04229 [Anaerolineae bacterium]|nr:hypothetical protein [Anaerolineae bacterium]